MLFTSHSSRGSLSVIAQDQGRGCLSRDVTMGSHCICAACVCIICEFSCLLRCDGGCICLSVDRGHLTPPSVPFWPSLLTDSLTALPRSALSCQEIGSWEEGRSQAIYLLPSLLLTVSPSAAASPCDSSPHQTGLWALRTPPLPLTYVWWQLLDVVNFGVTSLSPGCALNSLF